MRPATARRVRALATLVVAALALTACSTTVNETRNNAACGPFRSGATSDAVTARGTSSQGPTVRFPTPLRAAGSQVSVLRQGSGAALADGELARVGVSLFSGVDGSALQRIGYTKASVLPRQAGGTNSLDKSLLCRRVGERYALTSSAKSVFGAGAVAQLGLKDSSTLVLVVDVRARYPGKADGVNQLQNGSLPAVVTAVDGQPGIVLPGSPAPKGERSARVKAGGGATIATRDRVLVKFSQFAWGATATVQNDQSWTNRTAFAIAAGTASAEAPFGAKLVGERVGSQLLYVFPGQQAPTVWVVDVLGIIRG
ncbi:MAG: hypothetical protein HY996_10725 [Micrococcales bacterium]|nr:hypothetical protein [Micrococcales bacterium]